MTEPDPIADEGHRMLRESLGAYVLDGLDPVTATAVRSHLVGCAECRGELAAITVSAAALQQLRQVPPAGLADRIVERIRVEGTDLTSGPVPTRPSERPARRGLLAAAAAVAVVAVGAGAIGFAVGSSGAPTGVPLAVQAAGPEIDASAQLIAHTWGTEIVLTAAGLRSGAVYRVVVLDDSGQPADAGAFIGTGAQQMRCNLNSPVPPADATGFEVLDDAGTVVLSARAA